MSTTFVTNKPWYNVVRADGTLLWASEEEYKRDIKKFKIRFFQAHKAARAKDFEWETIIEGDALDARHKGMVLMRRTWESLRLKKPEKENRRRLREFDKRQRLSAEEHRGQSAGGVRALQERGH